MGLLNIIRRMHLRQKLSIREIARRTGLSRNTVAKLSIGIQLGPLIGVQKGPLWRGGSWPEAA